MRSTVRTAAGFVLALLLAAAPAAAQDEAPADSTAVGEDQEQAPRTGYPPPGGWRDQQADPADFSLDGPFFVKMVNTPKAGVKATVQQYQYYSQWLTYLTMRGGASFENTAGYSWADYRKQEKTIERREDKLNWNAGMQLPVTTAVIGNWDWSEDRTINAAGVANVTKRDYKRGALSLAKTKHRTGSFVHTLRGEGAVEDQQSINQGQRNDFTEGTAKLGVQTGWEIAEGVTLAGRLWGSTTSGTRSLGETDAPSSASGDTVGMGVYYDRRWTAGRVQVSRANFDKRYLDYRRNSNGLIDTVGVGDAEKVAGELETKDVLALEFENTLRLGRFSLETSLARDTDELEYSASGKGLTERRNEQLGVAVTFAAGRDSFALSYDWIWKWDDQRYKNATANRGRQYVKSRDVAFGWHREIFRATELSLRLHQGLNQDIAENRFNDNDKDRLDSDLGLKLERAWTDFRTGLGFTYKQTKDLSIREARSSNNNVKDSYEIAPGYTWDVADWLRLTQSYRLYIQYTDYVYSGLPSVSRADDYNKRGNLNTRVTIDATERLELTIRHDYNKRFNATRTGLDAAGVSTYFKDQIQSINKIDLGLSFEAAKGVALETGTYRSKDVKDSLGVTNRRSTTYSGEIWVGAKVKKTWGKANPLELSATVRKFNAYGPSVTETSRDYWDADVWLKWSF